MSKELKLKQYMFTFESGGWNTVWAKTLKGAIKQAQLEWKDSPNLNPIPSSVHLATQDGLETALQTFY